MTARKYIVIKRCGKRKRVAFVNNKVKERMGRKVFVFFVLMLFFSLFLFYISFSKKVWDGKQKISIVIRKHDGGVVVVTLDPASGDLINIHIPPETQVESARKFGVWRLSSLWELSKNEGIEGRLLSETLIKDFDFPISGWADSPAIGFSNAGFLSLIRAVFFRYSTNLNFADRLLIALAVGRVDGNSLTSIDLSEEGYLESVVLTGGEQGYVKKGKISPQILAVFADTAMSEQETRVFIRDYTGYSEVVAELGGVIEVLGAKVISVAKEESRSFNCVVKGSDEKGARKIAQIFYCDREPYVISGGFDIEVLIGEEFARRY